MPFLGYGMVGLENRNGGCGAMSSATGTWNTYQSTHEPCVKRFFGYRL